jgi:hypothetical protein
MTGIPCRRCGNTGDDVVVIYGPDEVGALMPRAAQCRDDAASGHRRPGVMSCPGR